MTDRAARQRTRRGREQQREATRRRLVEGGLACFARKGYDRTTVEDILSETGAGRATFYAHFNGKAQLLTSALSELDPIVDASYEVLNRSLSQPGGLTPELLHRWLDGWADEWERHAVLLRAAWQAAAADPDLYRRSLAVEERLTELMTNYLQRFQGASRERARVRSVLLQMMTERTFYTMIWSGSLNRVHAIDVLVEFWWSVLSNDEQPPSPPAGP
ncbi:TetR/AcrR family transcriptional regulator [Conexibacter sp. JD483]|uniref:TetR/AcrR family transcriptional regulator n=1 Tax=unclassified Conexibacter TaxID=2627773 RepID=UPI00271FDAE7|nr:MULTISPECIES: TetR/AcrR family transcriptional regulator [unclassified Conexibacter]MDO8187946.1 TetR/AcrR family transcriptional regulator [Conexibacter sp. CPCC 205706]MDO8200185.1 TetR/AcrR family transcriptional regulator [Conexibacter sp. CPCC 205762]MDR9369731.1 TetR/AcrR family transcriptional regulator [Conexibacter sp. JD483]